jgi:hypothetical protein
LRNSENSDALQALIDGIVASCTKAGVDMASATAYANSVVPGTAGSLTLQHIMDQKHIAMFTQPEAWTDWRRTGFPALTPSTGNVTGGIIPVRMPYPNDEYLFNPGNVPSNGSLTDNLWWDQ